MKFLDGDYRHPFGLESLLGDMIKLINVGYFKTAHPKATYIDAEPPSD